MYREKKLGCIWFTYVPLVLLLKPEAVKEALKENKFTEKSWLYHVVFPLTGSSFFLSPFSKWKPRRKLLTPCFHSDMLRDHLSVFNEQSQKLMKSLQSETTEEFTFIDDPISICTLNTICG
ncbi:cytochrome P450 4V2, partial [Nephila pilipes]